MIASLTIWFRRLDISVRFLLSEVTRRLLRKLVEIVITDLDLMARFRDLTSSVEFERDHLSEAMAFKGRSQLLRWTMEQLPDGDDLHLEFGVYKGNSINLLADLKPNVTWYGFDSFVGLPEDWTIGAKAGAFSTDGKLPFVRRNVQLVAGFFEQTMPSFIAEHRGEKIAFLHIDCDLYSSTKTVLADSRTCSFRAASFCLTSTSITPDGKITSIAPSWNSYPNRMYLLNILDMSGRVAASRSG